MLINNTLNSAADNQIYDNKTITLPIYLLMFYFVAEYAKPAAISPIRPAMCVQVLLAIYLIKEIGKTKVFISDKYFKSYLVLLVLMVMHVFTADNNYWAFMQFRLMMSYLIIGLSICVFVDSVSRIKILLNAIVLLMVCCAIDRLCGAGLVGISGVMGDENDFALGMNIALPISFFLGRDAERWKKWFFWAASILFILANITCMSRGGFIGLVLVGIVCWFYMENKFKSLLVLITLAIMAWGFSAPEFKEEIRTIGLDSGEQDTGKDRIELWKSGWRAFLDNPIIGVGQGNLLFKIADYQYDQEGNSFWGRRISGRAVHSVYFTVMPELGLVGIIILGIMAKDIIRKYKTICIEAGSKDSDKYYTSIKNINRALFVSLFAYLVTGVFLSAFYYPEFWNISGVVVALSYVLARTERGESLVAFTALAQRKAS